MQFKQIGGMCGGPGDCGSLSRSACYTGAPAVLYFFIAFLQ